jgi:hypothetical protein
VSFISGTADITFKAASGAFLKTLLPAEELLIANGRFESTTWTATALGPPLGGAAIGAFGPVATVVANAISFLLSALAISVIDDDEPRPARTGAPKPRAGDLIEGWRYIVSNKALRPLFFNTIVVNSLIMATSPLVAVLMLGRLHFAPWQYALAFGAPCVGGLVGSRFVRPLVRRFDQHRIMFAAGALRACWSVGLAFIVPGTTGIILVIAIQFGLVTCIGVFTPLLATYRLRHTETGRVARTLSAWSVTSSLAIAAMTALWGLLAGITSPRVAIATAGALMLASIPLLPRRDPNQSCLEGSLSTTDRQGDRAEAGAHRLHA